jgi:activating signal cointegrator complex subunit 1
MNDDPRMCDVLYGTVISDNLQEICNGIYNHFVSNGLSVKKHDNVKLHVTLLNSLFRDNDDAVEKDEANRTTERRTFDASKILEKYRDFYFGEIIVSEIHLSQRYSKATNGYYEATGILKLF